MLRNHVGWVKRACTAAATLVTGTPSTYFPVKSIERPSKSNQASIVILRVFSEDSCVPKGIANAHIYTKRIEWVGCRNVRQVVPIESELTTQRNLKSRHTSFQIGRASCRERVCQYV